ATMGTTTPAIRPTSSNQPLSGLPFDGWKLLLCRETTMGTTTLAIRPTSSIQLFCSEPVLLLIDLFLCEKVVIAEITSSTILFSSEGRMPPSMGEVLTVLFWATEPAASRNNRKLVVPRWGGAIGSLSMGVCCTPTDRPPVQTAWISSADGVPIPKVSVVFTRQNVNAEQP